MKRPVVKGKFIYKTDETLYLKGVTYGTFKPKEDGITFLDDKHVAEDIIKRVKEYVHNCHAHPAILCYTIGNEIPAGVVRWHGKKKIEEFLQKLYHAVKQVDPGGLVTYVNYPTTEYL